MMVARSEDLLNDGGEEAAQNRLITDVPGCVVRIGDLGCDRIGTSAIGLLDCVGRGFGGSIDMAKEMGVATEVGDHLHAPQHVVAMVEPHRDRGGDCHEVAAEVEEEDMSRCGSDTM
jgi:hypothetical protein